jgi:hypothetical protein
MSRALRVGPPSLPAAVFLTVALLVPLGLELPLLNSDGDLARHLRHGAEILARGSVLRTDFASFTRPGAPFIGFEYGSQVVFALLYRIGGLAAIAVAAGLLLGTAYALLTRLLLTRDVDPTLTLATVGAAMVLGSGHWLARPHLFTFLGTVLLLGALIATERPRRWWLAFPGFALWANLHGGWLFGLILIGIYLAGVLLQRAKSEDERADLARERRELSLLFCAALAGTLVTPYGPALFQHVLGFFRDPYLATHTAEFQSPDFHQPWERSFLVILLGLIAALAFSRRTLPLPHLLVLGATVAFALIARRNIALFAFTGLPLAAVHLAPEWTALPDPRRFRANFARTAEAAVTAPWVGVGTAALVGLAAAGGRVGGAQVVGNEFDARLFPAAVVRTARNAHLSGRLFHEFTWGGYLLWAWPEQRVFIDGGTDFYGSALLKDYLDIKQLAPGWRDRLDYWRIDLVLASSESGLAHEVARDGWTLIACDSVAALLRRPEAPAELDKSPAGERREAALRECGGVGPQTAITGPSAGAKSHGEIREPPGEPGGEREATLGAQQAGERGVADRPGQLHR